jgi:hypothetical protein
MINYKNLAFLFHSRYLIFPCSSYVTVLQHFSKSIKQYLYSYDHVNVFSTEIGKYTALCWLHLQLSFLLYDGRTVIFQSEATHLVEFIVELWILTFSLATGKWHNTLVYERSELPFGHVITGGAAVLWVCCAVEMRCLVARCIKCILIYDIFNYILGCNLIITSEASALYMLWFVCRKRKPFKLF